jgi:chorismate synthase
MNSFGKIFKITTFGESHGEAIGCIVDGVPSGLDIDIEDIKIELARRRPGTNIYQTQRDEDDTPHILSGIFEGKTTGTPIAIIIYNRNQKSKDYTAVKDIFRPSHGDFTYFHKFGIRDYRGGGRSSARETAARVAGGAIAKLLLDKLDIKVDSGIVSIGDIKAKQLDFVYAKTSDISSLDRDVEKKQQQQILEAKNAHDSVGGSALIRISDCPIGLGEPIYYKLDSILADAMMSINGVKGVEVGFGNQISTMFGSEANDAIREDGFTSNNSGGVLAGISNGDDIIVKVYFKPTPSIFQPQNTVDTQNRETEMNLKGRHDPCIAPRGSIVALAMARLVIADMLILNLGRDVSHFENIYKKKDSI